MPQTAQTINGFVLAGPLFFRYSDSYSPLKYVTFKLYLTDSRYCQSRVIYCKLNFTLRREFI